MEKQLLNVKEVATLLGISVRSVWKLASGRGIPSPVNLGRSVRWNKLVLENFIQEKQVAVNKLTFSSKEGT